MMQCRHCSGTIQPIQQVFRQYVAKHPRRVDHRFKKNKDKIFDSLKPPRGITFFDWSACAVIITGCLFWTIGKHYEFIIKIALIISILLYFVIVPRQLNFKKIKWCRSLACETCFNIISTRYNDDR